MFGWSIYDEDQVWPLIQGGVNEYIKAFLGIWGSVSLQEVKYLGVYQHGFTTFCTAHISSIITNAPLLPCGGVPWRVICCGTLIVWDFSVWSGVVRVVSTYAILDHSSIAASSGVGGV